jgi:hypothetical protein
MKALRFLLLPASLALLAAAAPGDTSPVSPAPANPTAHAVQPARARPLHPGMKGQARWGQLIRQRVIQSLHLTPEQQVQAKQMRERAEKAAKAIRTDSTLTQDQKVLRIAAQRRAAYRQFRELLTDSQREKLFRVQRALARLRRVMASMP